MAARKKPGKQVNRIQGLIYDSPYSFTAKQQFTLRIAPPLLAVTLKTLMALCKKEQRRHDILQQSTQGGRHAILAFWHEALAFAAWFFRNTGYHTVTSYSFDGELAARVIRRFGLFAVRGSSSHGGSEAVANLHEALKHVPCIGLTLDGPKGPRRVAKPGVGILAARSGAPVIPVAIAAAPVRRLASWDRMPVPKPGARVILEFGDPIPPPSDDSPENVESTRLRVEEKLNRVQQKIEKELGIDPFAPLK